jgi:hypothetical protein
MDLHEPTRTARPRRRSGALRGLAAVAAAVAGFAGDASAFDVNERIQLHGFVTQGWIGTTDNNYLGKSKIDDGGKYGTAEFFQAGVNVQAQILDNLRAGVQIFTRDVGIYGNMEPTFDWAYLDFKANDQLGLRAGRVRVPFGFHNDTQDVDSARTAILLPQSMYPIAFRDFMFVYNGASAYGTLPLGPLGTADYEVFAGMTVLDDEGSVAIAFNDSGVFTTTGVDNKLTTGGRVYWNTPLDGLRFQASVLYYANSEVHGRTNQSFIDSLPAPVQPFFPREVNITMDQVVFSSMGAEYTIGDLEISGEYGRWWGSQDSAELGVHDGRVLNQHRGYGMVNYRFTEWFAAGSYYSIVYNIDSKTRTHDVALTTRFDINEYWNVKLEAHWVDGTNYLIDRLNPGRTPDDWLMFCVSTSVTF